MKILSTLLMAGAMLVSHQTHAALSAVGTYAEGEGNAVDFSMNYSGNGTWTTGIGQTLGASQILSLEEFVPQIGTAFGEGTGGIVNFDNGSLNDNQSLTVTFATGAKSLDLVNNSANGGTYSISGPLGDRTAISGDLFMGTGGNPHFDLTFENFVGFEPDEKVTAIGVTLLGRNGQGTGRNFRVIGFYTNGVDVGSSSTFRSIDMQNGNATQDSFTGVVAPDGYWMTRVRVHSDQGIFTGIDDLAFMTDIVSSILDFEVPLAFNFGEGADRSSDAGLVVKDADSFVLQGNSLGYRPASEAFVSGVALAKVANYRELEDFTLATTLLIPQAPQEAGHRVGLALLGRPADGTFDAEDSSGFYGLVWATGEAGASTVEIREGFGGNLLAEAPWTGGMPVAGEASTVFFEDFESPADGWSSGGESNIWEIGSPVAGSGPTTAFSGQNVAATGLDANYGFNTNAWFRSPVIDLSSALEAQLRFQEFSELEDFGVDGEFHYTKVAILDADSGAELAELGRYNAQTGDWRLQEFALPPAVLGRSVVVEFRLFSDDIDGDVFDGWFIDDVEVLAAEAPVFQYLVDGFYRPDGSLTLSFTLMDEAGARQTVEATVGTPISGTLFGVGGRSRAQPGVEPEFGFMKLSMEVGPFSFAFGSDDDRDSGARFVKNVEADWSVEPEALRLTTAAADYHNSVATNQIRYFEPGENLFLEMTMTLSGLDATESDNRVGMVLFGADDPVVFDPENDSTYYTFQWTPNSAAGGTVAVREGMDGAILAQTDFTDLKNPPTAVIGGNYTFRVLKRYPASGGLEFWAVLTDESGGEAAVSGMLAEAPTGNRFGFGARHRGAESPVWDFHELNWLSDLPAPMPLDYRFGTDPGRDTADAFAISNLVPGNWSLQQSSLRVNRPDASTASDGENSIAAINAFYTPGQDFALRTSVSTNAVAEESTVLAFASGGNPENQVEVPFGGATPERGTVAVSFNLRNETGGTLIGHLSPRTNFSNRIYITYQNPERGITVRLGSTPEVEIGFTPQVGSWHHVALAWDNGIFQAYVDGVEVASGEYSGLAQVSDVLEIGNIGHLTRNEFAPNAFMKEASAWNIALSAEGVQAAMAETVGNEAGLVGYWPLNENEGSTAFDQGPTGQDGTIIGAEWLLAAPRFGLSFLGQNGGGETAFNFEWLPLSSGSGGELRIAAPGSVENGPSAVVDLSTIAGGPEFAADVVYDFALTGIHNPDGSLELTGTLSDEEDRQAEVTLILADAAGYAPGTWFGMVGRHSSLDWRGFQMGSPEQVEMLDPIVPEGWTFTAWQEQEFGPEDLADPEVSGLLASPAGDGVTNMLKYAFGFPPLTPVSSADLPQPELVDGNLRLTYRELWNALDIEYIPESSEGLLDWSSVNVNETSREFDGNYERVTVEAVVPEGAPRAFLRVRVQQIGNE